jgi:hypothetical protein
MPLKSLKSALCYCTNAIATDLGVPFCSFERVATHITNEGEDCNEDNLPSESSRQKEPPQQTFQ